jgi:L-fuculose-phosphate aldolase
MEESLIDALRKLAITHRILEMEGHGDMTQGHLSLRDPSGRGFWLKRAGIGIGEVIDHNDFVQLDPEGRQIGGSGKRHSEWPIHSEILRNRPEIGVVGHTHPLYASIFSATTATLLPLQLDGSRFANPIPFHTGVPELVNTTELGQDLARALGDAYAILMANHGITFVGRTIEQALLMALSLERACQAQLVASGSGLPLRWPDKEAMARRRSSGTGNETNAPPGFYEQTFQYYNRKLSWAEEGRSRPGFYRL